MLVESSHSFTDIDQEELSNPEFISDIPKEMRTRTFDVVSRWFMKFGVNLQSSIDALMDNKQARLILDHCCGVGLAAETLALHLAKVAKYQSIHVIGVDLLTSPEAVCKELKINSITSELIDTDAQYIPLPSNSISLIYSMAGLAYIDDALSAIKEAHRILKRSHKAYFYLLRGAKDICATGCLEDFLSKVGGAEFTLHAFLPSWLDYWRLHKQNSPYYLDGLILEMEKTAAEFSSPYTYVGNTPIFSNPQRPFEKHAVSGIYMRQPNG